MPSTLRSPFTVCDEIDVSVRCDERETAQNKTKQTIQVAPPSHHSTDLRPCTSAQEHARRHKRHPRPCTVTPTHRHIVTPSAGPPLPRAPSLERQSAPRTARFVRTRCPPQARPKEHGQGDSTTTRARVSLAAVQRASAASARLWRARLVHVVHTRVLELCRVDSSEPRLRRHRLHGDLHRRR